jgi:hypothetical protein
MVLARQVDFDQIVMDLLDDGMHSWEEAVREARDTFLESNYDISGLYLYTSQREFEAKQQMEARFHTLESVACGKESFVNMVFVLQGLLQTLRSSELLGTVVLGSKRMFEQRKGFRTILSIFQRISKEQSVRDDTEDYKANGEDSDGDDHDDDNAHYRLLLLEALHTLLYNELTGGGFKSAYLNAAELVTLTEEEASYMVSFIDEISDEDR